MIVAPFAAHLYLPGIWSATYASIDESDDYGSQLKTVSGFIGNTTGNTQFSGSRMIVAEWDGVALYDHDIVSNSHLSYLMLLTCLFVDSD